MRNSEFSIRRAIMQVVRFGWPRAVVIVVCAVLAAFGTQPIVAGSAHAAGLQAVPSGDGQAIYEQQCAACHQTDGEGVPGVFPPLNESEWVTGDAGNLVRILLQGIMGPMEVAGTTYSGAMPPWKDVLDDGEIAAVATYIRTSWNNRAEPVSEEYVRRVRQATEGRNEPWTAEDLLAREQADADPPSTSEAAPTERRDDAAAAQAEQTAPERAAAEQAARAAVAEQRRSRRQGPAPIDGGHFEKVVLVEQTTRPNELEVAPDGRLFFIEREGAVRVWNPETDSTTMVGFIPVEAVHTSGLLGMALDPDFERNGWMYLYYSPWENENINRLDRFTVRNNKLDFESRRTLLEIQVDRYIDQAHSAGSIEFGPEGNLFLSTGDNSNPTQVQYFSSIDERPGRAHFDVQRTSANTNDLRGKVLRITPTPDGGYSIPEGNLFEGDSLHRPEIYTMGHRNPYRISIDPETGWLYWGDVGHGASAADPARGPKGHDEFNQARGPGFFGWPYFAADNKPFRDYDFATGESGPYYDPERPINDSPNNTGARVLPPAQPALIWYPHDNSEEFPILGAGGQAAMAGPVYRYDPETVGPHGLPASYDGVFLAFDFMRDWIMSVTFDENGDLADIQRFAPEVKFKRPMDIDVGPDGRIYVIEWGDSYEGWYNYDANIVRLDYYGPGASGSDESATAGSAVFDPRGTSDAALAIEWPVEGGFFDFGRPIPYRIAVTGRVSGSASDDVEVHAYLGHDSHVHDIATVRGATGTFYIDADRTHLFLEDHFARVEARVAGEAAASGVLRRAPATVVLQPRRIEAEHAGTIEGAEREITGESTGGSALRVRRDIDVSHSMSDGNYLSFAPVNLVNISSVTLRVLPVGNGTLELRLDAPDGPLIAAVDVRPEPGTGADEASWTSLEAEIDDPGGTHELVVVARGAGDDTLFELDWMQFNGSGVHGPAR